MYRVYIIKRSHDDFPFFLFQLSLVADSSRVDISIPPVSTCKCFSIRFRQKLNVQLKLLLLNRYDSSSKQRATMINQLKVDLLQSMHNSLMLSPVHMLVTSL